MRLLVSVRSAAEAAAALQGGAHIIDAKEPRHGPMGQVSAGVLRQIAETVPAEIPLSVALGDLASETEVRRVLGQLALEPREGGTYLKLGFAAGSSPEAIDQMLATAAVVVTSLRCGPRLIAVAYADYSRAGLPAFESVLDIAIRNRVSGVLLDTAVKAGPGLTRWIDATALASWVARCRGAGLLAAVAGSLELGSLSTPLAARPDVIGVRGAACAGGRDGMVQTARVRSLVKALANHRLAKRQNPFGIEPVTEASTGG